MNVLLHDLSLENANHYLSINDKSSLQIVCMSDKPPVKCVGCFGCWIKNPGECIMKDGYNHMGEYFGNCEKIIIVTSSRYGEFSVFIKNIIDRSISAVHPYFVKRNGEMHHKLRYNNKPSFNVICYSDDLSGDEKETFEERVKAASLNLGAKEYSVTFTNGLKEIVI